jgi:hypothetical protein
MFHESVVVDLPGIFRAESSFKTCLNGFFARMAAIRKFSHTVDISFQMPLASHTCDVTDVSETLGYGVLAPGISVVLIIFQTESVLVSATHQSRSRRSALRSGYVAGGETNTLGSQLVGVGCFDVIVNTLAAKVGPTVVVSEDDDDIGSGGSGLDEECRNEK